MSRVLACFAAFLMAGCAELPLLGGGTVDGAVGEALLAARAPQAEQKTALVRAEQRFKREPSEENRLRLATLLAALPVPLRDDPRALELLEPVADPAAPGIGRFAALLSGQLAERQRLARELERTQREGERARREREGLERERVAADRERDKREDALRQQLEALRAIERNILEREDRMRKKGGR